MQTACTTDANCSCHRCEAVRPTDAKLFMPQMQAAHATDAMLFIPQMQAAHAILLSSSRHRCKPFTPQMHCHVAPPRHSASQHPQPSKLVAICPPACPPAAVICIVVVVTSRHCHGGGRLGGKLSRCGSETKCCGGLHHPAGSFSAHRTDTETHSGDQNSAMKELQNAQHHNHIYKNTFSNVHN